MDNLTMSRYLENFVSLKRMYLKEAKMIVIDKEEHCNYIYEKLFPKNNFNNIKEIDLSSRFNEGINFIGKELAESKKEDFIEYIKNQINEIDLVLYCIPTFICDLSNNERELLEELKKIGINIVIVIKNSEDLPIKELIKHYSYNLNELKIKEFFISGDMEVNNRLINQWESLCGYIESTLDSYYKDNFALGQSINKELRDIYIYNNLKGLYEDILEAEDREDLNSYSVLDINNILDLAKGDFINYYGISDKELNSNELKLIKEVVIDNVIAEIFSLENKKMTKDIYEDKEKSSNEEVIEVLDHNDEDLEVAGEIINDLNIALGNDFGKDNVIKEFLSFEASNKEYKSENRIERTEIMDYDINDLIKSGTEIMTYNVEEFNQNSKIKIQDDFEAYRNESIEKENIEIEKKFKIENQEQLGDIKKYNIVNMSENKTFKEITISDNYGMNEAYDFEEEKFTIPLAEIEEVADKQKSVIWNNESALEDLNEFELTERSTVKFKKFNMND